MNSSRWVRPCALVVVAFLSSCSLLTGGSPGSPGPSIASAPLAAAEVVFSVTPPQGTADNADLALMVLDELTGLAFNARSFPMTRMADGRWQVRLTPSVGSIVYYRYVRQVQGPVDEMSAAGEVVRYRVAHIPGPMQFDDLVAAWADAPYAGPTGRIVGRLSDAFNSNPLPEILVMASGISAFTDSEGRFRIDGLPPGTHNLTAISTDGAYRPIQQGAVVAADSATPADLGMTPAPAVMVSFEVTLPPDTPPDATVRIAGNLRQFGHTFSNLGGLSIGAGSRMPALAPVDASHRIFLTQLYAGTHLRYRYTLGDGFWNSERDPSGGFVSREVIISDKDLLLADTVGTWQTAGRGSVTFRVQAPDNTPFSDFVSIQLNPFTWYEPLPMTRAGEREWLFVLYGPLDFSGPLPYRYCRNLQCGMADDAYGLESAGVRAFTPASAPQEIVDTIEAWRWWGAELAPTTVVAPSIVPRPEFEAGVELLPAYEPEWDALLPAALSQVASIGSNAVVFTPTWTLRRENPNPILGFDPAYAPFSDQIKATLSIASQNGLLVALKPTVRWQQEDEEMWWYLALRNYSWWTVWFEEYRSFVLNYARIARDAGAQKLILGGPDVGPSYPGGVLPSGVPSGVPDDSNQRWQDLINEIRSLYGGTLAFEIDSEADLASLPAFLDSVDRIHVYWHTPLGNRKDLTVEEMQQGAASFLDGSLLASPRLGMKPIVLSVEYLSIDGAAMVCPKLADETCRDPAQFDQGAIVEPDLQIDLWEQAAAINAVLFEAYARPSSIAGFYVRRYNPMVGLEDRSASVNGKPAQEVLGFWYPRITGKIGP